jgi:hypothetical protein
MTRHRRARHAVAVLTACITLSAIPLSAPAEEPRDDEQRINDCGVNCLYTLLRLSGRKVDLSALRATLPPPGASGYSMAELREAAGRFGLGLAGVRLAPRDMPLDRPVIVLRMADARGHYVVLKPVGQTGTMVQVLDFPKPPRIMDYSRILASEEWTGLALVPDRPLARAAPYLIGLSLAGITFIGGHMLVRRGKIRPKCRSRRAENGGC